MNDLTQRESFALCARVLGALFSFPPDREPAAPLADAFIAGSWITEWPLTLHALPALAETFSTPADETVSEAFQRLFIGPYALPAPPWGSVWLDRESVLFGESTLALRQWMRENNIVFQTQQNTPEDHFGALLLMAAWLTENGHDAHVHQLLAWHLLPWSTRFLAVFVENAGHPFYVALGELAGLTLAEWQTSLPIPVAEKALYR